MISKSCLTDLMKENLKRRLWSMALTVLACFFALPVFAMLMSSWWTERLIDGRTILPDIQAEFYSQILSAGNIPMLLIIPALALLNAMHGMAYLSSRTQSDLYDSLPVKRTKFFASVFINGLLVFFVPYLVFYASAILIGLTRHYVTGQQILYGLGNCLITMVMYTNIYALSVLAAILTGHIVTAVSGAIVLLSVGPLMIVLDEGYRSLFFSTYFRPDFSGDAHWKIFLSSPVAQLFGVCMDLQNDQNILMTNKAVVLTVCALAFSVLFTVLSAVLLKKRPSEAAGHAMAFPVTKPFIKLLILIPETLTAAIIFYGIGNSFGWFIFGLIAGLFLGHAVIEIIYEFDFRACLHHWKSFGAGALISLFIISFYLFDWSGFDRYIPEESAVDYSALHSDGINGGIDYGNADSPGRYEYIGPEEYRLTRMKLSDTEDVNVIARAGVEKAELIRKETLRKHKLMPGDATDEFETEDEARYASFTICWVLKNGRRVYRRYSGVDMNNEAVFSAFDGIYRTEEYKNTVFPCLKLQPEQMDVVLADNVMEEVPLRLTENEKGELIDRYKEELLGQTAEELRDEVPVAVIRTSMFMKKEGQNNYNYSTDGNDTVESGTLYVYPSFGKTVDFLASHGIRTGFASDEGLAVSAEVTEWVDDRNYEVRYSGIEDADKLKQILDNAVPSDFYYLNYALIPHQDDAYAVNITLNLRLPPEESAPGAYEKGPVNASFLPGRMPDFVKEDLEKQINNS